MKNSDKGNCYLTLGKGKKAKKFWVTVEDEGYRIFTGKKGKTSLKLSYKDIELYIKYFRGKGWFLLGNNITNVIPGGLGEYFKDTLKRSPKFASHVAALLVNQRRLKFRHERLAIELKVITTNNNH